MPGPESQRSPTLRDPDRAQTTPEALEGDELAQGTSLGRYVILKRIGRGGMGIVYLAFDNELERRVALKVLRPVSADGGSLGEVRARLLREAQALAKVSHPNVVAVFDVGSFGDEVFVAMEYIDGATLREWRAAKSRSVTEVVGAYVQAGRGLEAAHAAGILHRDFKPENLLVDERGRVKVVDFGLARLEGGARIDSERPAPPPGSEIRIDPSGLSAPLTELGALVGTPPYMAPEQLVGEKVDTRTDQFSFCLTLHEALYGEKPFAAASSSVPDLVDAIYAARFRPVPATPRVPRGIRRAIRRGLSGEPDARFASMADLLAELERAIGSPRRWGAAIGVSAVAVAALAFVSARPAATKPCHGAEVAIAPAWSEARAAEVERAFQATHSPRAGPAFTRTRALLDRYAASWVTMNTSACEDTRVRGVQSEEGLDLRMGCLQQRAKELSATVGLFSHADAKLVDGAVEAAARLTPVDTCVDIAALRAPFAPPRDEVQRRAVDALRERLAEVDAMVLAGQTSEAYPIASAMVEEAEQTTYAPARAEALWRKGEIASHIAKPGAASALFDAAAEAEGVRDDTVAAKAWTQLVYEVGFVEDHSDEAARYARLAESAIRRLGSSDSLQADLLDAESNVAYGRSAASDAQRFAREALVLRERSLGPSHPSTLQTRSNLADSLWDGGETDQALALYEDLYAARVAMLGETHPGTLRTALDIAEGKRELGDYPGALQALDRIRDLETPDTPEVHVAAMKLQRAYTLIALGRLGEGKSEFQSAIALTGKLRGEKSSFVRSHYSAYSRVLVQRGENALAETNAKLGFDPDAHDRGEDIGEALGVLALCEVRRGDAAGAVPDAERALSMEPKTLGTRADLVPLLARGEALLLLHREKDGLVDLERALSIGEANPGDAAIRADVRFAVARALVVTGGDRARATTLATRAADELDRAGLPENAKRVRSWLAK